VLLGQFFNLTHIKSEADAQAISASVREFSRILDKHPRIKKHSYFILVPTLHDFGLNVLPKPEPSQHLFEELEKHVPFVIRATNPCHVAVLGKTFVIARHDCFKELRKYSIVSNGSSAEDIDR
jgi:DNA polymerase II small subunit/DNA polymerase delta subunit B